ncbi:isopentenyl-diphosphate Delta-isomerase [Brachybacterium sp. AOP43-C2-M15]|uniref:isopentenyl-diphosphate Delta-isomerase n=1 Tax=Brachybacterium sp. AOP43-C2-M15 TaxID=3457661 RepID=UPI0040339096
MTDSAVEVPAGEVPVVEDHVVLLEEDGRPRGLAPRATVHTEATPLHLAFSCHLVRPDGRVLLTRRALTKRTWPGVWTNSFCGHPRRHETMEQAITRYAQRELDLEIRALRAVLPDFRYRAADASGLVENEVCPVFVAEPVGGPRPSPDEVAELRWVDPADLDRLVEIAPWALSPWAVAQLTALRGTHWLSTSGEGSSLSSLSPLVSADDCPDGSPVGAGDASRCSSAAPSGTT